MTRQCIVVKSSEDKRKHICIDKENAERILAFIHQSKRYTKKFWHIVELLLENKHNSELYDKEDISAACKDVTAMKFFKGQENARLYCKEVRTLDGMFYIIAAELLERKKQTGIKGKPTSLIEKISKYNYVIR